MAKGVLLDLDGVIYDGDEPIRGAADAVRALDDAGVPHLFLTNTTSKDRAALVRKLDGFGIPATEDRIWYPAAAAASWLGRQEDGAVALFVREALREEFREFRVLPGEAEEGARFVVVGDLGDAWDYATLNRAFRLLHANADAEIVALGMTAYYEGSDGLRLDVAPFVTALRHASGRKVVVLGKPAAEFFGAALRKLGAPAGDTLMVGDDIRTDVGGAQKLGMKGALVRTGKFRESDLEGDVEPDEVLDSIADLPAYLGVG